jgi:DsbC/DsbD-like thiol-disulfide interchange protein
MAPIFKPRFARIMFALGLAFTCFCGMHTQLGAAQSFSVTHAKVSLIAEGNAFQRGHTEWVGVLFDLEKGWHIYWVNPGDSGEPPKIQWQLPTGFHAGDIRWPVPSRLGTGTVIDYGYDGRVLLPVPIEVPPNYSPASQATLAADVRYLICREVCIPAKAHVTLAVPVAGEAAAQASARQETFRTARQHWPAPMPAGWKVQAVDQGQGLVLDLQTGAPETKASFFPLEEDQIDNAAPQRVSQTPHGVQIALKKSDQLLKPIATLKGVVVFGGDSASERAFEITVPVVSRRAAPHT